MQRSGDICKITDIPAVVGGHSHKCSDIRQRRRCRKILYGLDFLWVWMDSPCGYNMSQKLNRFTSKLTFRSLELQASCFDSMQDLFQNFLVFLPGVSKDNDVIDKYQTAAHPMEKFRHHSLKGGWGVCQAEGHNGKLVMIWTN